MVRGGFGEARELHIPPCCSMGLNEVRLRIVLLSFFWLPLIVIVVKQVP